MRQALTAGPRRSAGTTHKTVKRVIARHEAGGAAPARAPRARNYDVVAALVAERVEKTPGRISAKRLLPVARAAGMPGRRGTSAAWSRRQKAAVAAGSSPGPPSGGVVAG